MRKFNLVWVTIIILSASANIIAQSGRLAPGTGIITGSIQMEGGGPASGIRVAAIPMADPPGSNLASVTETDSAGRFRLADIPQGRYYVIAGKLSSPTFFGGSGDRAKGTGIVVEPARTISNIDFKVPADSRRPEQVSPAANTVTNAAETAS
jgi:hypothetical protein